MPNDEKTRVAVVFSFQRTEGGVELPHYFLSRHQTEDDNNYPDCYFSSLERKIINFIVLQLKSLNVWKPMQERWMTVSARAGNGMRR
jgi:hypothetical protein